MPPSRLVLSGPCFARTSFPSDVEVGPPFRDPAESRFDKGLKDMTKVTFASHPYLLGFEELDRLVERTAKTGNDGYPPYNIEQRSDASYRITLAVAGFAEADIAITLESNQLVIRGRQGEEGDCRVFLHRGIAARQFQRSFVLADGVEVSGATLENGLLHIDLVRAAPETVVRTIEINQGRLNGKKI